DQRLSRGRGSDVSKIDIQTVFGEQISVRGDPQWREGAAEGRVIGPYERHFGGTGGRRRKNQNEQCRNGTQQFFGYGTETHGCFQCCHYSPEETFSFRIYRSCFTIAKKFSANTFRRSCSWSLAALVTCLAIFSTSICSGL